ncbi:MAG: hypothetical protein AB7U05_10165 [Mangrovibacterium sp.]
MEINVIRKKLVDKLNSSETYNKWIDILQDTNPGNYGVEDVEISVDYKDIWVVIPEKTFTSKNAELIFSARLGGSSAESGYDANFRIAISGNGQFEFTSNSQDIRIVDFSINEHLDLYPEKG